MTKFTLNKYDRKHEHVNNKRLRYKHRRKKMLAIEKAEKDGRFKHFCKLLDDEDDDDVEVRFRVVHALIYNTPQKDKDKDEDKDKKKLNKNYNNEDEDTITSQIEREMVRESEREREKDHRKTGNKNTYNIVNWAIMDDLRQLYFMNFGKKSYDNFDCWPGERLTGWRPQNTKWMTKHKRQIKKRNININKQQIYETPDTNVVFYKTF